MSRVLIKIASRSRPDALAKVMSQYEKLSSGNPRTGFLISLDSDDPSMWNFKNPTKMPCAIVYGISKSKIDAINRDLIDQDWEYLVVGSDDAVPLTQDWDDLIRQDFEKNFDSTDGVMWYPDGYNYRICCQPIIGRKYYERFGYIYHPSYLSLYCDDELTNVAKKLGLLKQGDSVKFDHGHYRNRKRTRDALDSRNEAHMKKDYENYRDRMRAFFPR